MSDTAKRLYEYFKAGKQYFYSPDTSVKYLEQQAVKELEKSGYIIVKMNTIGYVIAVISK